MLVCCTRCGKEKASSEFPRDKYTKLGFKKTCLICANKMTKNWRERKLKENPNYYKEKYWANPEAARARARKYVDNNRERINREMREKRRSDPELRKREKEAHKKWYEKTGRQQIKEKRWLYGGMSHRRGKPEIMGGFLRGQGFCIWCEELNPLKLQIAHIFPDNHDDVISLCGSCHLIMDKYPAFLDFFI